MQKYKTVPVQIQDLNRGILKLKQELQQVVIAIMHLECQLLDLTSDQNPDQESLQTLKLQLENYRQVKNTMQIDFLTKIGERNKVRENYQIVISNISSNWPWENQYALISPGA